MEYLEIWRRSLTKSPSLRFVDILLKGYGQVLICLNPLSGLLLSVTIFYLSKAVGLLALWSLFFSTLTAFLIGARPLHIKSGVYGFNGVVLGVAWLWFLKMNLTSVILLAVAAVLSSLLMKLWIDRSSKTKANLPAFTIPAVLLIWLVFVLLPHFPHADVLVGPDSRILEYLKNLQGGFDRVNHHFTLGLFLNSFDRQMVAFFLILLGVFLHSRISALFSFISFLITLVMIYWLGGKIELQGLEFYLYNTVPCGIALGGTFLVPNHRVTLLTLLSVMVVIGLTYLGMRYFPLPVFVLPFNLTTTLMIWLTKYGFLKRDWGFVAVPMELISTPEVSFKWREGELYAERYWRDIEKIYSH